MGFPFDYALTGSGLEVRLGGRTVRRVDYANMESARRGWSWWHEKWVNWWPYCVPRMVLIRRRDAWITDVTISPDEPERFLAELRSRGVRIER